MVKTKVRELFPEGRIMRSDSFSLLVGHVGGLSTPLLPVTRIIRHNSAGKNHKCDSRCTNAKGHDCECACGGAFHGINA